METPTRTEPQGLGDELAVLTGFLAHHRETLAWKTSGLSAAELNRPLFTGGMTLGGMLSHLAYVEDYWFTVVLLGEPELPPWSGVDWSRDEDYDWHLAADMEPEALADLWTAAVVRAEAATQGLPLDTRSRGARRDGPFTLRWILVHMIEEYARHNGHADLLREAIDGLRGE